MSSFLATTTAGGVAIFAGRAVVAFGLGAAIGLERQWRQPGYVVQAVNGTSSGQPPRSPQPTNDHHAAPR